MWLSAGSAPRHARGAGRCAEHNLLSPDAFDCERWAGGGQLLGVEPVTLHRHDDFGRIEGSFHRRAVSWVDGKLAAAVRPLGEYVVVDRPLDRREQTLTA